MNQKKDNKPCGGQFPKEQGQRKQGRKQSGFGAGQEKGGEQTGMQKGLQRMAGFFRTAGPPLGGGAGLCYNRGNHNGGRRSAWIKSSGWNWPRS